MLEDEHTVSAISDHPSGHRVGQGNQLMGWVKGQQRGLVVLEPTLVGRYFPYMLVSELMQNLNLIAGRKVWTPQKLKRHLAQLDALITIGTKTNRNAPYATSLDLLSSKVPVIYKALILAVPQAEVMRIVGCAPPADEEKKG